MAKSNVAKLTQNSVILVFGELPSETTVRNVVQVLQPLEVRNGDTAGIQVQVGNDEALIVEEDLVCGGRDGTVGTLGDDLGLDATGIVSGDDLLLGTRAKNVALLLDERALGAVPGLGTGEADNGAVLELPLLECLHVDAVGTVEVAIPLGNTDALGAHSAEVARRVEADVTETLHDEGLVLPAKGHANHFHVLGLVEEDISAVEDTATSRRDATVNATWFIVT